MEAIAYNGEMRWLLAGWLHGGRRTRHASARQTRRVKTQPEGVRAWPIIELYPIFVLLDEAEGLPAPEAPRVCSIALLERFFPVFSADLLAHLALPHACLGLRRHDGAYWGCQVPERAHQQRPVFGHRRKCGCSCCLAFGHQRPPLRARVALRNGHVPFILYSMPRVLHGQQDPQA